MFVSELVAMRNLFEQSAVADLSSYPTQPRGNGCIPVSLKVSLFTVPNQAANLKAFPPNKSLFVVVKKAQSDQAISYSTMRVSYYKSLHPACRPHLQPFCTSCLFRCCEDHASSLTFPNSSIDITLMPISLLQTPAPSTSFPQYSRNHHGGF